MPFKSKSPVRPWMVKAAPSKAEQNESRGGNDHTGFYRNAPWRKLRARKLEKDPNCEHCWEKHKRLTPATMVDHITPIKLGGEPLDMDNLASLCSSCHARKSAGERRHINKAE